MGRDLFSGVFFLYPASVLLIKRQIRTPSSCAFVYDSKLKKMTLTFSRIIDFDDVTNLFLKQVPGIFMRGSGLT